MDMATVAVFILFGKMIGAAKEVAVAWRYGISPQVDAYVFVFNLVNYPVSIFYGVISASLIPVAARLGAANPAMLPRLRAETLGASLILGCVLAPPIILAIHQLISLHVIGDAGPMADIARRIVMPLGVIIPLGCMSALFSTWTMYQKRQINTLFESLPALSILLLVLLWDSAQALIWGTLAGFALCTVCLALSLHQRKELVLPSFGLSSEAWPVLRSTLAAILLAQTFQTATGLIDQVFAAQLQAGSVATLGYASRLLSLLLSLSATAIGRSVLPNFSHAHACDAGALSRLARRWAAALFVAGLLVAALCELFAHPAVALLFERGAFTPQATARVSSVLQYALVQLPFGFATIVTMYALYSQGRHRVAVMAAATGFAVKLAGAMILAPILGLGGLMLGTALASGAILIISGWQLTRPDMP